ncbi:MAG TPA: hypothetical protein VHT91_46800 [Kofleriaceae bacterium]|jgi:hypothetical protein|nr:hypothetical protein [Kofleriaceae bacterium]
MDKLNKYDCVELIDTLNSSILLEHLEASGARTMLVGGSAEAPRAYYSFSLPSGQGPTEIGAISSGLGTVPAALVSKNGQRAVIGHDIWITWIDLETLATASSHRLDGVFFEFLTVDSDDETVVLHELGALRIDVAGSIKWSVDTDVVENWSTGPDGSLILNVMDGPSPVVSLVSGAVSTQG